jgi:3'-5' exonuclease
VASVLGAPLDKSEQCSPWHKRPLSDAQIAYASNDAAVLLALLDAFVSLAAPADAPFRWQGSEGSVQARALQPASDSAQEAGHIYTGGTSDASTPTWLPQSQQSQEASTAARCSKAHQHSWVSAFNADVQNGEWRSQTSLAGPSWCVCGAKNNACTCRSGVSSPGCHACALHHRFVRQSQCLHIRSPEKTARQTEPPLRRWLHPLRLPGHSI